MFPVQKSLELKNVREIHYRIKIFPLSLPGHRFYYMAQPYFVVTLRFFDDEGELIGEMVSHDCEKLQQNQEASHGNYCYKCEFKNV